MYLLGKEACIIEFFLGCRVISSFIKIRQTQEYVAQILFYI